MFATLSKYFSPVTNQDEEIGFLQIFKPLYVSLTALGLFPQAIQFPDGIKYTRIVRRHSTVNFACALFMIITVYSFFIFHLKELELSGTDDTLTEGYMTLWNYYTAVILEVLVSTICFFCVIRDGKLYIMILNDMADCWYSRLAMGKRRLILGKLRVQVNCFVLGTVLVITLLLMAVEYTGELGIWKMILTTSTFLLPELIQFAMLAFYFVIILMIGALLKHIEEECKVMVNVNNNVQNDFVEAHLVVSIADIREVYVKTLRIKRQINKAFQAPILAVMATSFHELVYLPHLVYHGLVHKTGFTTHNVVQCIAWLFVQLVKLFALAHSGAHLKAQVNEIGRTIHNIPLSGDQDLKVYLDVQHFSSLMTYQDPTISIYGFFVLDANLMFNILASAAMYFVILIQFDNPE